MAMIVILVKGFIHLMVLAFIVALVASHYLHTQLKPQFFDIVRIFVIFAMIDWFSMLFAFIFAAYEIYRYYNMFEICLNNDSIY